MRIGIDVRPLSRPKAGIFRCVSSLLQELQRIDKENSYFLYSDRDFDGIQENSQWRKRVSAGFRLIPGSVWLQSEARKMATEDGADVFWGTAHALPLLLPAGTRNILTVHDVAWATCPENMALYNRCVHHLISGRSIRKSDVVCVPSHSTRESLQRLLGGVAKDIRVVYWGVEDCYFPHDRAVAARYIANKFSTSEDYVCTVGTIEPRKNLPRLIEAFDILRVRYGLQAQLLIAGAHGWKTSLIHRQLVASGLTEREVRFLGYVPEEDMPFLYSGASVFVLPSLYEGFGLPLIEAMACGAPIVASNTSSIPEVVGDAGVLADPYKPEEVAEAIIRFRADPGLRAASVQSGLQRVKRFSWTRAAKEMLSIFCERATRT
ncbi:MAG: glycosyltransferase family 4 protein [Candidatus Micrarchaeaceae archaeon]